MENLGHSFWWQYHGGVNGFCVVTSIGKMLPGRFWAKDTDSVATNVARQSILDAVIQTYKINYIFQLINDWSRNHFSGRYPPSADSWRAVISYWRKYAHRYWLTLRRLILPKKKCKKVNSPARHDLNSVNWAVNPQRKQTVNHYIVGSNNIIWPQPSCFYI